MQQQQQGMVGNHGMMGNQAAMVNAGRCDGYDLQKLVFVWMCVILPSHLSIS